METVKPQLAKNSFPVSMFMASRPPGITANERRISLICTSHQKYIIFKVHLKLPNCKCSCFHWYRSSESAVMICTVFAH